MSRYEIIHIDLIERLSDKINNPSFNSDCFSKYDGERLIQIGQTIIREIERKEKLIKKQ